MTDLIGWVANGYTDLMENKSDPRVRDWTLMSGPGPTILICLTYALIVKVIGPKFMEKRKPYQLRKILIAYNFFQVLLSAWLFYEAIVAGWFSTYSFRCQPVDYSYSPKALRTASSCWWYYFSKFVEFFDTFFFVLRKKNDQITRLHVIHHGVMPLSTWFGVKFTPGGHSTFFGMLNTFVHIIMYAYYMLAAIGPQMQKYLWWKKYLTSLQMIQFILVMAHAFQLLFIDCNYPKAFVWWIGLHAIMFYFLFSDFYKQAYKKSNNSLVKKTGNDLTKQNTEANNKHTNGTTLSSSQVYQQPEKIMKSSYTTEESLRTRAFINKEQLLQ
uniref:Elongation of very long chain fatty acids protein n=1 Tax=Clastoptera arizonana TaxID=38151 RepID=A0A1B6CS52_9HEMI